MDLLIALVLASAVLVLIPGPNVALIVANSVSFGTRFGLLVVAGTTVGIALQLCLTVFGLAALVSVAADILIWLKWLGVAYLIYLGVTTWRTPAEDLSTVTARKAPAAKLFWGGLGVALVNPKTLLFNSAFLPQFVSAQSDLSVQAQFVVVSMVFLAVMGLGDSLWALLAGRARYALARYGRARNRIAGAFLIGAGAALAFARR